MKQVVLIVLAVSAATALFAQPLSHVAKHHHHIPYPVHAQAQSAKTTAGSTSRCIAEVDYVSDGTSFIIEDSSSYSYTGDMGGGGTGWAGVEYLKYSAGNEYIYNPTTDVYSNENKYSQTFDVNNNVITYLGQNWDATSGSWEHNRQDAYAYDAMNNLITETDQIWGNPTAGIWNNFSKYTHTYDIMNHETMHILQFYNSSTGGWDNEEQDTSIYDGSGNLVMNIVQEWNDTTGIWDNEGMVTYIYDGAGNCISILNQQWNSVTSTWDNYFKSTYSSFIDKQPQIEIDQYWDPTVSAFVDDRQNIYTYNSYAQITYFYSQTWDASSGSWQTTTYSYAARYYYEEYPTGIPNIANAGGKAQIYPVPAKNTLSINVVWDAPQAFTISMYDMQGRTLRQWQVAATAQYKEKIPVNDMPSGNYIIKMEGAKGHITQPVTITN